MRKGLIPLHGLEWNPEYPLTTRRKVWLSCCLSRKSQSSLTEHDRKPDTPFPTPEESIVPCLKMRWGLTPLLKLDRNPKIPVTTGKEPWVSHLNSILGPIPLEWLKRNPSKRERRPDFPDATWEAPWCPCCNLRHTMRFPTHTRWGLIPLPRLKRNPEVPLATRNEAWNPWDNKRGSLRFPLKLKRNPMLHTATWGIRDPPPLTWEEALFPCSSSRAIPSSLLKCKKRFDFLYATQEVPWDTCQHLRGNPSFPPQFGKSTVFPNSPSDAAQICWLDSRETPTFPSHQKRRPVSPIETWEVPGISWHKS